MKLRQPRPRRAALAAAAVAACALTLVSGAAVPGAPAAAAPADGAVRTFDDEPLGEPPADCRTIGDVTVAEAAFGGAAETNRAMRVVDQDNAVYTRAWCNYPQTEERSVSYRFSPAEFNAGPYVAIQGAEGTSANGVWRFTFNRDGDDIRVAAYDGSSFADVATIPGGATLNEWVDVTINATTERAELVLNGVRFETERRNAESPTMGEIFFGSAGQSAVGVDYYIDDLAVSGELPEDAFAGLTIEPLFDDEGLAVGTEVTDEPVARFYLPEGAELADYTAVAEWQGETIPAVLSGPDEDGWVTVSISHTFAQAGVNTLRTVVTDTAGNESDSTQEVTVAGEFSTLTFENDDVGSVPAECSTLDGYDPALVSDEAASEGERSLRVQDTSSEAAVGISCPVAPQQGAYLSFDVNPTALEGFTFDIVGDSLLPTGHPANSLFRLRVIDDGSIEWYEQWTRTWRELAPAGSVPLGEWSQIEVAVPSDNAAARVSVGGEYVGSAGSTIGNNSGATNEVTAITGLAFTTGSTGVGAAVDDLFIDDVTFGTAEETPAEAVGTAPFTIGDTVTIDDDGEDLGFPLGGILVPTDDGGRRIIFPYSASPDRIDASGFLFGMSDDDGASWTPAVDLNPMPDASGITVSRLRNGDIIAVDFNTFMVEGSDNRQATVETAISSDGGTSWEHRDGVLDTPEPMRPIGATSPRPGTTLGGFVLLHTLLEDPDGTLYISAYGYYEGDENYRQLLLVSEDGGINWSVRGTVAVEDPELADVTAYDGPSEGAVERLADGSLYMVMRTGWHLPMLHSRSTDDGATWSEPEPIDVGPAGQDLESVQPTMEMLPSGELLLMVGRPGLVLTMSESGRGDDWSVPVGVDYNNSENGAFTVLDSMNVVVAGDRGRVAPWEVWSRNVSIAPPCEQTITGAHDGSVTAGAGGLCLDDANVSGDITVSDGGRLIVQDSEVTGSITSDGASVVAICGSGVTGPVSIAGTTGQVSVGDTTAGCEQSTIGGTLSVTGTAGPVVIDRSEVADDVTIADNSGRMATILAGLTVDGSLACTGNAVVPTDSGVPIAGDGPRYGQCGDDEEPGPVDGSITASVQDEDGAAVAGGEVTVSGPEGQELVVADGTEADLAEDGGVVTVAVEGAGDYEVTLTGVPEGYEHEAVALTATVSEETPDVTLEPFVVTLIDDEEPGEPGEPVPPTPGRGFYLNDGWGIWADHEFSFGRPGDEVLVGDWDGDGSDTLAVRRGNAYFLSNNLYGGNADVELTFGRASDTVLVGDWDGDGADSFAVRRGNSYFLTNSLSGGNAEAELDYGRADDQVLVGDYDADGADSFAVRRGNTYYVSNSLSSGWADAQFDYGRAGDQVLVGDWDGDGADTFASRRGNLYLVSNSLTGGWADIEVRYGRAG
ncbi:sialidase family protein, partial [Georgenia sp. Z1491]|uniref:sialidase family protein n=1 Tax=Georgenia sp. Z1491 TaxID=3416707 RepID=UPI003CF51C82